MTKTFRFIGIFVVLAMLLAACQPAATPTQPPVEPTQPPAEPTQPPPVAAEELVFGLVLVGPKNDHGWSQAHYTAGEYVQQNLPGSRMIVFESLNPADKPEATLEAVVSDMIADGAKLIITTSDEFEEDTLTVAKAHPETIFINVSGDDALTGEAPANLGNIMGRMEDMKAIAGCAAALATQTGKIGYLGPLINNETRRLASSAYLGARYCYENYRGAAASSEAAGPFRVAVVMPSAINDLAFSQSMYDGLNAIKTEMGADKFDFAYSENMFVVDDAAAAIRDYASQGFDLVIAHGSQYGSSLQEIAPDFPDTAFAWGTTVDTFTDKGINNVFAYEARSEQGGYVNGVIAASLSKSNTLGVVGPIETGDAKLYVDGFAAGAKATKSDIKVNVNYIGSFSDVALASAAAQTHLNAGADGLTGTAQMVVGAIGVAKEKGVPWFGTQSNQTTLAPDIVVANQVYDWTVVLNDIIPLVKSGTMGGKSYALTLANGGLKIEYNPGYALPADVKALADKTIAGIIDGSIVVGEAPVVQPAETGQPGLQFTVTWIGFWFNIPGVTLDPTEVTNSFFDSGVDVVLSGIDTTEGIDVAGQRATQGDQVWSIPYDFEGACDQAPDICLGVPYFNWGPAYLEAIKAVQAGTWKQSWDWNPPAWDALTDNTTTAVGWVNGPALTADMQASLDQFIAGLSSGDINVWTGSINLQDGTEYIKAGATATDKEIWYLPKLLEGMEGPSE